MDAIATVVLGGGSLSGGLGSVIGTFIASLTLAVMRNGLTLLVVLPPHFVVKTCKAAKHCCVLTPRLTAKIQRQIHQLIVLRLLRT